MIGNLADQSRLIGTILLIMLASCLILTNKQVTVFEDEASIVTLAARNSALDTLRSFLYGRGQHEHPPLFDLFLHFWLRITDEAFILLRLPSIVFFCCSLWLVAETAQILWNRRLVAILVGIAWPTGYFLGRPAHWSSLAMLCIAGSTWSYFWWRKTRKPIGLAAFSIFSVALIYTNYLGWAFLFALGTHFILSRPNISERRQALVVALVIVISFLPLLRPFLFEAQHGTKIHRPIALVVANAAYYSYSLFVSEAVAPWYWPAIIAAIGIFGLLYSALNAPKMRRLLGLLVLVYVPSCLLGVVGGNRIGLFGPWLILYLTGLLLTTTKRRIAIVSLCLVFAVGWAGVITEQWYGTYRYTEPWPEAVSEVIRSSRPGDAIIANHPSFYFYAHYELAWPEWYGPIPEKPIEVYDREFAPLSGWQEVVMRHGRVIYVRSVLMPDLLDEDSHLEQYLRQNYHLVEEQRFLKDRSSELKRQFFGNQPPWRIRILYFER